MQPVTLGDIHVSNVVEVLVPLRASKFFPGVTEEDMARHRGWLAPLFLDPTGKMTLSMHTFIVRTRHHTIVVDTCFGNDKERPSNATAHMRKGSFLEDLKKAGLDPEKVDFVLCTHMHIDHVGWNTRLENGRWVPTFPKARYLFHRKEWEHWTQGGTEDSQKQILDDSVRPVLDAGLAQFVDGDHEIEDGVRILPLPGHTPGHVGLHLSGGGRRAIMTGDMMHHAVQVAEPDWNSRACADAQVARATRRGFIQKYADTDALVLPAHFPPPTAGHIVTHGEGWRYKAVGTS